MWLCGLGAILVSPAQRFNLLWFVKSGVAVYRHAAALTQRGPRPGR